MKYLYGFIVLAFVLVGHADAMTVYDPSRDRKIPLEISYPLDATGCTVGTPCPVAFVSAGYGVPHTAYSFLVSQLNRLGYLVVAVGHELPGDPPLSVKGDLYQTRSENWRRGANTLVFLQQTLKPRYPSYDFNALLLVGHSNGGDISAWLVNEGKAYVKAIITLDHRRVPLPRKKDIGVLSIRASDFPADKGVLPSEQEQQQYGSCVVKIPQAKHNDMSDYGPPWLKQRISALVKDYLSGQPCDEITHLSAKVQG